MPLAGVWRTARACAGYYVFMNVQNDGHGGTARHAPTSQQGVRLVTGVWQSFGKSGCL